LGPNTNDLRTGGRKEGVRQKNSKFAPTVLQGKTKRGGKYKSFIYVAKIGTQIKELGAFLTYFLPRKREFKKNERKTL